MTFEANGDWLAERLFERRIVVCRGIVDDALAGRVAAELMTLDALGDDEIELQLDAGSGSLEAAFTLVDVLDLLGVPVQVTCTGRVEGPAVAVVAAVERSRAFAHTSFRLVDPEIEIGGRAAELSARLAHHTGRLGALHRRIASATGRSVEEVADDFARRRSLSSEEALAYGLISEIVGGSRPLRPLNSSARRAPTIERSARERRRPLGFDPSSRLQAD